MQTPTPRLVAVILNIAACVIASPAHATHMAGERFFPAQLITDDPGVDDQASLHPMVVHNRNGMEDNTNDREIDLNFEVEKTITDRLSFGIDDGYSILNDDKRLVGWQNIATTLKYQVIEDDPRELISSIGIIREWGGTGRESVGAEPHGSTTPTFYFGKGFGDLPNANLRPLAITGTLGLQVPDAPREDPYQLAIGLSVQYSFPYLRKHAENVGLSDFAGRLTPLVELAYTIPTTHNGDVPTKGTVAPGVIYIGDTYQLGVAALLPLTRASGTGMIVQFHFFFADIFPQTLGKPLL